MEPTPWADDDGLDARVRRLEHDIAVAPDYALPALWVLLAGELIERYGNGGDPADLDRAIDELLCAVGSPHVGPYLTACCEHLALAYGERARNTGELDDFDGAIRWCERLRDLTTGDDHDAVVMDLVDYVWDRSWTNRHDLCHGTAQALADVDHLMSTLDGLTASGGNPAVEGYLRLMRGAARLERYTTRPDGFPDPERSYLDQGIAWVSAARTDLPPDDRFVLTGLLLSVAYYLRFDLDAEPGDLDRTIGTAQDVLTRTGLADAPLLLLSCLGDALQARWTARQDPADLDAAIDARAALRAGADDGSMTLEHAELLSERAERTGDGDDARAAAALFVHAATITDDEPAMFWGRAGEAFAMVSRLTGDTTALDTAAAYLDRALVPGADPGDDLLALHLTRLEVERLRDDAGLVARLTLAEAGQSPYRSLIAAAEQAAARSPHAEPEARAQLSLALGMAEMFAVGQDYGSYDFAHIRELLTVATTARELDPGWHRGIDGLLGVVDMLEGLDVDGVGADGVARLTRLLADPDLPADARPKLRWLLGAAMMLRSGSTGDLRAHDLGRTALSGAADADDLTDTFIQFLWLVQRGRSADAAAVLADARPVLDAVTDTDLDIYLVQLLRAYAAMMDPLAGPVLTLPSLADLPAGFIGVSRRLSAASTASAVVVQAEARGDDDLLLAAAVYADELSDVAPHSEPRLRLGAVGPAALGYLALARRGIRPNEFAAKAAQRYTLALSLCEERRAKLAATLSTSCGEALRLMDEPELERSRELGMAAMRVHAWQVFLQSGTEHGLAAARDAAANARVVAAWCVQDRAYDDLVGVLDAGRALVLRASTGGRSVPELLVQRGRADLADEWRATSGLGRSLPTGLPLGAGGDDTAVVPDELRLAVLRALGGEREVIGLRPVTVAEIAAALAATGGDALVHLLAGDDGKPGQAVIVTVHGEIIVRELPGLHSVAGQVRPAGTARDATAVGAEPATDLEQLCEWAWTAAMEDVLRVTARPDRLVRLVLLPFGLLGAVPWHAAGDALDRAVLSYSPSARMFCDGGAWAPAPVSSSLVVGDPRGDLAFAGVEARAVHERFYPHGTCLGRTAGPDDVLDWVSTTAEGPSVLHFACHAAIDADRPTEAHLLLSGGRRLSAGALLDRSRSAALDVEQVFLAACTTGVTGSDHDEVLSLATSFLAAGARTVFGSLWPVPDTETSLLMYMVHRYLRVDGLRPADALHRAQLWMRSPTREVPADLPAELRARCAPGTVFPLVAWAGFSHYGR